MDLAEFERSLRAAAPPPGVSAALRGLWLAGRGDWEGAHAAVQDESDRAAAWVHAYLHRQEGDLDNAAYWYARAARAAGKGAHGEEWRAIVRALLEEADRAGAGD